MAGAQRLPTIQEAVDGMLHKYFTAGDRYATHHNAEVHAWKLSEQSGDKTEGQMFWARVACIIGERYHDGTQSLDEMGVLDADSTADEEETVGAG